MRGPVGMDACSGELRGWVVLQHSQRIPGLVPSAEPEKATVRVAGLMIHVRDVHPEAAVRQVPEYQALQCAGAGAAHAGDPFLGRRAAVRDRQAVQLDGPFQLPMQVLAVPGGALDLADGPAHQGGVVRYSLQLAILKHRPPGQHGRRTSCTASLGQNAYERREERDGEAGGEREANSW